MTSTGIANVLMPMATVANAKQTSAKDASGGDFRQMMQMQKKFCNSTTGSTKCGQCR